MLPADGWCFKTLQKESFGAKSVTSPPIYAEAPRNSPVKDRCLQGKVTVKISIFQR